jgi:glycosyltransferase involved in cell wall biosynthesis
VSGSAGRAVLFAGNLAELAGSCVVGAWTAQALVEAGYLVDVITLVSPGLAAIDAACGTRLAGDRRLTVHQAPPWIHPHRTPFPLRLALLRRMLLERWARAFVARTDPDLVISTTDETDLGRPAVQYIHFPWGYWPRPDADLRWFHVAPLVRAYRGIAHALGGFRASRMAANTTLANSEWTASIYRAWHRLPAEILHPPVPVHGRGLPWRERDDTVLTVARMSPEKRLLEAIAIVRRVREAGWPLRLAICGRRLDRGYQRRVARAIAATGGWAELHLDLPRDELVAQMARARYGLHTMIDEHFGIAVAELVRMGCLTFVHASGGARAIVDEPLLCFAGDAEAVDCIVRCCADSALRDGLRDHLAARAPLFGTEPFTKSLLAHCEALRAATGINRR